MKKFTIVVVSALLLLALVGCGTFSYDIRKYVNIPEDYATNLTIRQKDIDKQIDESRDKLLESYKGEEEITTGTVAKDMTAYIYYAGTAKVYNGLFSFKLGENTFPGLDEALKDVEFKDGKATLTLTLASGFKFPEEIAQQLQAKADAEKKSDETTTAEPATEDPTTGEPATETATAEETPDAYNPAFILYDEVDADAETTGEAEETAQGEANTETPTPEDPYATYNDYFAGKTITVELTVPGKEGKAEEGETLAATMKITHVFSGGTYNADSSQEQSKSDSDRKGFALKIGSESFIPGFEDGMIGMSVEKGTKKSLDLTFPSPYTSNTVLSGMDVVFDVEIQSVWNIYKRDLKDATQFAALKADYEKANGAGSFDYKDEADYIEGLTANIKASLAATELVNKSKVTGFKYSDLEDYKQSALNTYANYYYSITGTYPDLSTIVSTFFGGDYDTYEKTIANQAGKQLKNDWVLYQVAKDQGLDDVTSEEYDKFISEQLAVANAGRSEENAATESDIVKTIGGKETVKKYIVLDKAQKWLGEHVKVA